MKFIYWASPQRRNIPWPHKATNETKPRSQEAGHASRIQLRSKISATYAQQASDEWHAPSTASPYSPPPSLSMWLPPSALQFTPTSIHPPIQHHHRQHQSINQPAYPSSSISWPKTCRPLPHSKPWSTHDHLTQRNSPIPTTPSQAMSDQP